MYVSLCAAVYAYVVDRQGWGSGRKNIPKLFKECMAELGCLENLTV